MLLTLLFAAIPSFPGAEGFGAFTEGGRGGDVIKVTTLSCDGPGSLAEALEQEGRRIVVFEVSGVIDCSDRYSGDDFDEGAILPYGDVTIAGQTAPGGGITLYGRLLFHETSNIVVRHLRVRVPSELTIDGSQKDAMRVAIGSSQFMIDHVSLAYAGDETLDMYESHTGTVQWSTFEDGDPNAGHIEPNHHYGALAYDADGIGRFSIHHNLFAHVARRAPAINQGPAEAINNVVYNSSTSFHNDNDAAGNFNVIGYTLKAGPDDDTPQSPYWDGGYGGVFMADFYVDGHEDFTGVLTDYEMLNDSSVSSFSNTMFDFCVGNPYVPTTIDSHEDGAALVLARAGAFPRDAVTTRMMTEYNSRTGGWGFEPGERLNASNLFQGLSAGAAPADTDNDGIADSWEAGHDLVVGTDDHNKMMPSGYTAIEEYLNALAEALVPARVGMNCEGGSLPVAPSGVPSASGPSGTLSPTGTTQMPMTMEEEQEEEQSPSKNDHGVITGCSSVASPWWLMLISSWHVRAIYRSRARRAFAASAHQ